MVSVLSLKLSLPALEFCFGIALRAVPAPTPKAAVIFSSKRHGNPLAHKQMRAGARWRAVLIAPDGENGRGSGGPDTTSRVQRHFEPLLRCRHRDERRADDGP